MSHKPPEIKRNKDWRDICLNCGEPKILGTQKCSRCGSLFENQYMKYPTEKDRIKVAKKAWKVRKKSIKDGKSKQAGRVYKAWEAKQKKKRREFSSNLLYGCFILFTVAILVIFVILSL
jgi:hypothetical protein